MSAIWVPKNDVTRLIPAETIFPPVLRALEEHHATEDHGRPPISAAVIVADGRVLMVRRRIREGQLSWQFPAGEIEPNETAEQAAVRETREEVGLVVSPIRTLGERVHPATGRTMIYVTCMPVDGTAHVADTDELAETDWCDRAAFEKRVTHPLFEPVREYLDATLR